MRRLLVIIAAGALAGSVLATPVAATTSRVPVFCDETLQIPWSGGREWVDESFVYHSRGGVATYVDVGSPFCAGVNHATLVSVNLDLTTGEGVVIATAHIELDAYDGGWDTTLVAHFTPTGEYIWEGKGVGQGFGAMTGYGYRVDVVETSHERTIISGFVLMPGQ